VLDLTVTGVVLLAAVAHASWNAILHAVDDKFLAMTLIMVGGGLFAIPLVVFAPAPDRAAWPFLATSVALQFAYNLLLVQAYRLGDFGQMYPLARGVSPVVVTGAAAVFAAEVPTPAALVGVAVVFASLTGLVLAGRRTVRITPLAFAAATATGLTIAAYTIIDGLGARRSGSAAGYVGWLLALEGLVIAATAVAVRGRKLITQAKPVLSRGLAAGLLGLVAYGLVLWAQTQGALAPVAALRETSVIAAAVIGTLFFSEPFGRARILATIGVAAGILILTLG
jgi:drug/metabolite transporter (DMT)-like permease